MSVETTANAGRSGAASARGQAGLGPGLAAGRLLRGPVHGHPRPEHRQRRAALDPVEPRLLLAGPAMGRRRLRDHVRGLSDARRTRGRPLRAAPDARRRAAPVRARLARRRRGARPGGARRRARGAGLRRRADGRDLAGDHHRVVPAGPEAPPGDRPVGGDERARRRGRRAARRDHHRSAQLALGPADQPADRDRGRAGGLRGRERAPQRAGRGRLRSRRRADADDRSDGARVRGRGSGPEGLGHVQPRSARSSSAWSCSGPSA